MKGADGLVAHRLFKTMAAAALVATVLFAHLFMPRQISALASEAIRSLHGPGFGLVALFTLWLGQFNGPPGSKYVKAAAATFLLAVISEIAQIPGAREAQVSDLLVDALGIGGFLCFAAAFDHRVREQLGSAGTMLLALVAVTSVVVTILPTAWLTYALTMRNLALPQILSFDKAWESTYSSGEGSDLELIDATADWPDGSGKIARLRSAGAFGLMLHLYPYPDWSEYAGVSFVAATPDGHSRRIAVGLWGLEPDSESSASRFYTTKMIDSNPSRHCISFEDVLAGSGEETFDLNHVSELLIGATRHVQGEQLLVDDFRLEPAGANCPSRRSRDK